MGTVASCVAVFAKPVVKGKSACLMMLGVICRMMGDFSSTAASAVAVRLSRFCTF